MGVWVGAERGSMMILRRISLGWTCEGSREKWGEIKEVIMMRLVTREILGSGSYVDRIPSSVHMGSFCLRNEGEKMS